MAAMEEETTHNQSLPNDIIIKVLTFLPPKPLTRFKLLSKAFLSLINNPNFILSHIQRSISTLSNLSLAAISHDFETLHILHLPTPDNSTSPTITKLPLPFTLKSSVSDLIGSCNGILCVAAFPDFVGLVNPTSMTFEDIPLGNVEPDDEYGSRHWVDFGFGFDGDGKDYKVVRVDQVHSEKEGVGRREVRVFILKRKLWKKVDDFPYFLSHPKSHGKFLCNSLHWIAITSDPVVFCMTGMLWRGRLDDSVYDYLIVAFDVNVEKFRVLPLPDCYDVGEGGGKLVLPRLCVGVLGEWLFVQVEHGPKFGRCVDVWVMKEYGVKESWTKLLSFPYMEVRNELLPVRTLALSKGGKEVLMQLGKDCFWYELRSGVIRDVMIDGGLPYLFELISGHRCFFGAEVYVESLVCLSDQVGRLGVEPVGNAGGEDGELDVNELKKKIKEPNKRCGLLSSRFKLK